MPYRTSDLLALIDDRMGKLENKKDISPYRNIKQRLEYICQDPRYAFMFGSLTVHDSMAQILGRIFRVPVASKPITILELTGIPHEIVNVVVSVLCRMTFDFALWSEGAVPVTLVCEEAHRYVPLNASMGFEPCKRAIAKIAKEGRKYGASLCIVTQRPSEIDPTILSQCNTVFALRMSNDRDQEIVTSAISDTGQGLLEFLPALGQREAIAFGDGVDVAGAHQVRRIGQRMHAALFDRPLLREVAALGRRRRLPRRHRRTLARIVVGFQRSHVAEPRTARRRHGQSVDGEARRTADRHGCRDGLAEAAAAAARSGAAPAWRLPRRELEPGALPRRSGAGLTQRHRSCRRASPRRPVAASAGQPSCAAHPSTGSRHRGRIRWSLQHRCAHKLLRQQSTPALPARPHCMT